MPQTNWRASIFREFSLSVTPQFGMLTDVLIGASAFTLSATPQLIMGIASRAASVSLPVTPQLGVVAESISTAAADLVVSPTLTALGHLNFESAEATLSVSPGLSALATINTPAAPSYDATGTGSIIGGPTVATWSHTIADGAYLLVAFADDNGTASVSSVTCGSTPMTLLTSEVNGLSGFGNTWLYGLPNVPGGTKTITVTMTGTVHMTANSVSYTNVASVGTPVATSGRTGSMSQSVTGTAYDMIVQVFGAYGAAFTGLSGGTTRYNNAGTVNSALAIQDSTATSATFAGTNTSGNPSWAGVGVVLSGGTAKRYSRSAALSVGSSLAAAGGEHYARSAALSTALAVAAVGHEHYVNAVGLSVTPTIHTATAQQAVTGADLGVTPTLAASGAGTSVAAAALVVTPSLTVASLTAQASAELVVTPSVTVSGSEHYVRTATLAASPGLSSVGTAVESGSVSLAVTPTLSATGVGITPPVFDSVSGQTDALNSVFFTHVATAGSLVILAITQDRSSTLSSVEYGSAAMTLIKQENHNNSAGNGGLFIYALAGAPGGSQKVTATTSSAWLTASCASYLNATSATLLSAVSGSGTALSQGATPSSGIVVQAFSCLGTALTSPSGGTNRYNNAGSNSPALTISDASASTTFTAAHSSSTTWAGVALQVS